MLPGRSQINKEFGHSPNAGVLVTPLHGKKLRIDVLSYIVGIDAAEAEDSAMILSLGSSADSWRWRAPRRLRN